MLCFIPARGGSKRIPKKNIKPFITVPILWYPVNIALSCGFEVVVSTDCDEIALRAELGGAEVHSRLPSLAEDRIELEEVLYEYLRDGEYETCCMMLPTSVFAKREDLIHAQELLHDYDLIYSIVEYEYPPQRALRLNGSLVEMVGPEHRNSQDIPKLYHDAAQFYVFDVMAFCAAWSNGGRLLEMRAHGIEYKRTEAQDIDTIEDWEIAEMKYRRIHGT